MNKIWESERACDGCGGHTRRRGMNRTLLWIECAGCGSVLSGPYHIDLISIKLDVIRNHLSKIDATFTEIEERSDGSMNGVGRRHVEKIGKILEEIEWLR